MNTQYTSIGGDVVPCTVTKRAHEFSHFNYNILQQLLNPHIDYEQKRTFAKIYASNFRESIDKFGDKQLEEFVSGQEIMYMADRSYDSTCPYEPWVKSQSGIVNLWDETLLHFPYDKFSDLLSSITNMAGEMKAITLSVYRLSDDSDIVRILAFLIEIGVTVTILIEVNAKGNEEANIRYAHQLKLMGAQVIISDSIKKNHAKFIYIDWFNHDPTTMVMTGNLNEVTANIYEDYCFITSDPAVTAPMWKMIMQLITSLPSPLVQSDTIFFTQKNAAITLAKNIREQTRLGKNGFILIKCNLFTDPTFMALLEVAADAGCQVVIICRGECCWKPNNPNVKVHRFIHKYLEHSRVYVFGKRKPRVYIGSLDLATHKLFGRFELICKVKDERKKATIVQCLTSMIMDDTERHYMSCSDGNKYYYTNRRE